MQVRHSCTQIGDFAVSKRMEQPNGRCGKGEESSNHDLQMRSATTHAANLMPVNFMPLSLFRSIGGTFPESPDIAPTSHLLHLQRPRHPTAYTYFATSTLAIRLVI